MQCPNCRAYCDDSEKECLLCGHRFSGSAKPVHPRSQQSSRPSPTTARMNPIGSRKSKPVSAPPLTQQDRAAQQKQTQKKAKRFVWLIILLASVGPNLLSHFSDTISDIFTQTPTPEVISPVEEASTDSVYVGENITLTLSDDDTYTVEAPGFSEKGNYAIEYIDPAEEVFPNDYPSSAYDCFALQFSSVERLSDQEISDTAPDAVIYAYQSHNEDDLRLILENKFGTAFWLPLDRFVVMTSQ